MRKIPYLTAVSLVTLGVSTAAIADVGVPLPSGSGVNNAVKSPPLRSSDTWVTSIDIHNSTTITNWVGYMVFGQVVDPTEVTLFPSNLGDGTPVTPSGGAVGGVVWDPSASGSGITLPASVNLPIMTALVLHAENTSTAGNDSQFDLYVDGWNIRHIPGGMSSTIIVLEKYKDGVWATSSWDPGTNPDDFDWPEPLPPGDPNGHFVSVPYTVTVHVTSLLGSGFYYTLAGKATIDIQHVPEPTAGALALSGVVCFLMARRARRRRLAE